MIARALPGLGDLLCCVPALRAFRAAFPGAYITLIGLPQAQTFVQRFSSYLNEWLEFPDYPGISEVTIDTQKVETFFNYTQQLNFDLALQMHGSGLVSNGFVQLLGAKQYAGCIPSNQGGANTNFLMPYPEQESEIWRCLRLREFLGISPQGDDLEFPIQTQDWPKLKAIATTYDLHPHHYVGVA